MIDESENLTLIRRRFTADIELKKAFLRKGNLSYRSPPLPNVAALMQARSLDVGTLVPEKL
jgi:hypothetical protein